MEIWTDGSCEPNPGPGGWAWVDSLGNEHYGWERSTTNNRMEMMAILKALQAQSNGTRITVYSDSQYCVKGLTIWRAGWKRKNWRRKGEEMPNRDLWLALEEQMNRLEVSVKWVRSHNGNEKNERADELANLGRKLQREKSTIKERNTEDMLAELLNEGGVDIDDLAPWQWETMVEILRDMLGAGR